MDLMEYKHGSFVFPSAIHFSRGDLSVISKSMLQFFLKIYTYVHAYSLGKIHILFPRHLPVDLLQGGLYFHKTDLAMEVDSSSSSAAAALTRSMSCPAESLQKMARTTTVKSPRKPQLRRQDALTQPEEAGKNLTVDETVVGRADETGEEEKEEEEGDLTLDGVTRGCENLKL